MALKALGIASNEVNLRGTEEFQRASTGIEHGGIDATVVPHSNSGIALAEGCASSPTSRKS